MPEAEEIICPLIMSSIVWFVMSGIITTINPGFGPQFMSKGLSTFAVAPPAALVPRRFAAALMVHITRAISARLPGRGG